VVGTILEAPEDTQRNFFTAVKELFSEGGQLPAEYHHQNKDAVISFSYSYLHHFFPACRYQESCRELQVQTDSRQAGTIQAAKPKGTGKKCNHTPAI
jgi:hypothetical protein